MYMHELLQCLLMNLRDLVVHHFPITYTVIYVYMHVCMHVRLVRTVHGHIVSGMYMCMYVRMYACMAGVLAVFMNDIHELF